MQNFRILVFIAAVFGLLASLEVAAFAADRDSTASGQRQTLIHNGIARSYVVRAPRESARRNERMPLVLVLHGGGGNAAIAESMTGFTKKAATEGFIVVYPEGTSRFKDKRGHDDSSARHRAVQQICGDCAGRGDAIRR